MSNFRRLELIECDSDLNLEFSWLRFIVHRVLTLADQRGEGLFQFDHIFPHKRLS
jgi:hypothetical protein